MLTEQLWRSHVSTCGEKKSDTNMTGTVLSVAWSKDHTHRTCDLCQFECGEVGGGGGGGGGGVHIVNID